MRSLQLLGPSARSMLAIASSSSATSRTEVASRARFLALRRARSLVSSAFWRSLLPGGRWSLALTAWFRYASWTRFFCRVSLTAALQG